MPGPKKPMRPSSREALDGFISEVMALKRICKADPDFLDEMCQYFSAETERLTEVVAKAKSEKSPERIQEALNLNKRLSIMSLFINILRL